MSEPGSGSALSSVTLFRDVPADVLTGVTAISRVRTYPQGQILCNEGDPGDDLIVLEEGQLRVSRFTADGTEAVLAVYDAPAAIGELALLDGAPRDATITAQREVTVRFVPREAFLDLLAREPAAMRGLLRTLAHMIRDGNTRHADLVGLDVPGRLAKWLIRHAAADGGVRPGSVVEMRGSQSDLAAELGTTRSTLNRALHEFSALGIIDLGGNRVTIRKPGDLETYTW